MNTHARNVVLAVLAASAAVATSAHAEIMILRADGSKAPSSQASKAYNIHTGGWDIHLKSLYAPGGVTSYIIRANAGEIIDNVLIDVECWKDKNENCIPAGSPVFVYIYSDAPDGLRTIHNIEQLGTAETLLMHAEATHDIGSVSVETITTLVAGRDIVGPVIGTTLDNPYRGVQTVIAGRDVRGDISATRGRIERIEAGRHIGNVLNAVTIQTKYGHLHVDAQQDLHADITAGFAYGPGRLAQLQCARQHGVISTPHLGSAAIPGRIAIREHFDGIIMIGGSLADEVDYIQLPPDGLTGQIIINADNHATGTWDAPIYLGPPGDPGTVVLNGPLYELPSGVLGGGSIGLAPFRLHDQSCSPANGDTLTLTPGFPAPPIALQHYGPITWHFGEPVTIERRLSGTEMPFSLVPDTQFLIYRSDVNPTRLIIAPEPGAQGFEPGFDYRIRPTTNLRCDIPEYPLVKWQSDYVISIVDAQQPPCTGDLNDDHAVDVADMLLLLSAWGPASANPQADINGDGAIDVSDLLLLLNHWGACPSPRSDGHRLHVVPPNTGIDDLIAACPQVITKQHMVNVVHQPAAFTAVKSC